MGFLPGLEPTDDQLSASLRHLAEKKKKVYKCQHPHCNHGNTLRYVEETGNFECSACGHHDHKHTNELNALAREVRGNTAVTHTLWKTGDEGVPPCVCDEHGDVVLAMCRDCGAAEIDLEYNPCPNWRK